MDRITAWAGVLLLLLWVPGLAAQAPAPKEPPAERPTTVTADHLEVNRKERKAIYTGNAVARSTDLTVTADRMEFLFDEKMEEVTVMVAIGNVHIHRQDGTKAVAERATYFVPQERVVLEGHPRAWREGNMVSGTRMTLYLEEDRQVVEGGGSDRVTAVIYPKRESKPAR